MNLQNKPKLISADYVRSQISSDDDIEEVLKDIVDCINEEIEKAISAKEKVVLYELNDIFDIPNMEVDEARDIIYYHLLTSIDHAGYKCKLIQAKKTFVQIDLVTQQYMRNRDFMKQYVREHTVMPVPKKSDNETVHRRKRKN